jgi:two-component system phosphate regulon sensor histidine kinase PhoR
VPSSELAYGYRRIVLLLVWLVVVPTALLVAVGVILLFLGDPTTNLLMGILVMALSGAATTGVILVWVFVRKEANLSRLQSDFVSKVSHELRTPLTSIRLFTETLELRRGDPAAEDRCIEALARESARLQELIDRLLDWGRMESGRREFVKRPVDARSLVEATLASFASLKERRGVELHVQMPPYELPVNVDRGAMMDALTNLLTNAVKYGGEAPVVRIAAERRGKHVRIAVSDNGRGIPKVEHDRIFQKFYRVDDRLSRIREGSGLGLAIVKHVMKAHKGRAEVDSAPGRGSTFTLVLRADPGAREPSAVEPTPLG